MVHLLQTLTNSSRAFDFHRAYYGGVLYDVLSGGNNSMYLIQSTANTGNAFYEL